MNGEEKYKKQSIYGQLYVNENPNYDNLQEMSGDSYWSCATNSCCFCEDGTDTKSYTAITGNGIVRESTIQKRPTFQDSDVC